MSGGDCLPAFRSGTVPTPSTKKAQVCKRHAWALDAWSLALFQLINQFVYFVSAPFRIIKGKFRNHISYMGIANMIKNVTVMSTSPVNRVNTKRGDT